MPVFTHATGLPFMRFNKPQSPFLSRVLNDKLTQRHNLFQSIKDIDEMHVVVAAWEDEWDNYILHQLAQEGKDTEAWVRKEGQGGLRGWKSEVGSARWDVWGRLETQMAKMKETATRMMEIVDKERDLQQEERSARRHANKVEKRRKKEEATKGIDTPEGRGID